MERSLISWNIPNLITVPLMAILGWLLLVLVWQLAMKGIGAGKFQNANSDTTGAGGY